MNYCHRNTVSSRECGRRISQQHLIVTTPNLVSFKRGVGIAIHKTYTLCSNQVGLR
jgi:hypothetical protein